MRVGFGSIIYGVGQIAEVVDGKGEYWVGFRESSKGVGNFEMYMHIYTWVVTNL